VERVKPGLTGFWQVNGRSEADLNGQETLDTYYIRKPTISATSLCA